MTHYSQIPEKPLIIKPGGRIEKPQRVYFFERKDGTTFSTQEQEAWTLYSKGNQIVGSDRDRPKLIGTGDGLIFQEALLKSQQVGKTNIEEAQDILRKGVEDELEACRGKIIPPRDFDKFGDGAQHI